MVPYDNQTDTASPIDFLPNGNVATFTSSTGLLDYTVLNRIVPLNSGRAIELNGSVLSTLEGGSTTGGRIWFYSPGGILVGSGAVFDVGSLLLTTIDPNSWTAGDDGSFTGQFGEGDVATLAGSRVAIANGAQIKALEKDSYIALIAPRIEQGGNVQVNGSAAYVAANQMSMTFSQGLFDVTVPLGGGTDDLNGVVHSGTTVGPPSSAGSPNHTIYIAAVPKNQAMMMLLGGNIGFATGASVQDGQIILSAGWTPTIADGGQPDLEPSENGGGGTIHITGGEFSSNVWARADSDITAETLDQPLGFDGNILFESENGSVTLSGNGNALSVGGNADLYALGSDANKTITIAASNGGSVDISGDVYLDVGQSGGVDTSSTGLYAGTVNVSASGGTISTGNLTINASAAGNDEGFSTSPQDGNGGTVNINTDTGGTITVNGDLTAIADGDGGNTFGVFSTAAGRGYGGDITIKIDSGSLDITGNTLLSANGIGGGYVQETTAATGHGGDGYGGLIEIQALDDGSITTHDLGILADGIGGAGLGNGGYGGGGGISLEVDSGGAIKPSGEVTLVADGIGGDVIGDASGYGSTGFTSQFAGQGHGGNVTMAVNQGVIDITGALTLSANGTGGNVGGNATFGFAGSGSGGNVGISSHGGSITVGDSTNLVAQGTGGNGQDGASGYGGTVGITAYDGTIAFGPWTYLSARGQGGDATLGFGGSGGVGTGGEAFIEALSNPGSVDVDPTSGTVTGGDAIVDASGAGGTGGAGNGDNFAPGAGGDGYGGMGCGDCGDPGAYITADGTATVSFTGSVGVLAEGYGGTGGTGVVGQAGGLGGAGYGGFADAAYTDINGAGTGDGSMSFGALDVRARGIGGDGGTSDTGAAGGGGFGSGGEADLDALAGTLTVTSGNLSLSADGNGGGGGFGGEGDGGAASAWVEGELDAPSLIVSATGNGGNGSSGDGGYSSGGDAELIINGGTVGVTGNVYVTANANTDNNADGFGDGGAGTAYGGNADGGYAAITITSAGGSLTVDGDTNVVASGLGGSGGPSGDGETGTGGYGAGGEADFLVGDVSIASPIVVNIQDLIVKASGFGGVGGSASVGGAGGEGDGGIADIEINAGSFSAGNISALARGIGGDGGTGIDGIGGDGGFGSGGSDSISLAEGATINASTYLGSANGLGGAGGTGASGAGDGGSALAGTGDATIDGDATFVGPFADGSGFVVTSFAQGGDGTSGGSATGGSSSIVVNGSLSTAGTLQASASAIGGQGSDNGGDANAGSASITINGDASAATMFIFTNAIGGDGSIAGGNASAGTATLAVDGGSLNITDFGSLIEADATGGTGTSSNGTAGAGTAKASSYNGGDVTAPSLIIEARGDVGTGSVEISAGSDCDCTPGSINATDLSLFSSNSINVPTIGTDITVDGRLSVESDLNITFADVTAGILQI